MASYRDLSDEEQVALLRPAAAAGAVAFGLDSAALELVAHAFNTTFAVVGRDGQRHALRVHTNSVSTPAHVVAQQTWQHDLSSAAALLVPQPLRTLDGTWYAQVDAPHVGASLLVTAATWLEGPDVGDVDTVTARELGRTMARLHEHAASWTPPPDGELPVFDDPLFGDADLLDSAPGLSAEGHTVIDRAREVARGAYAVLHAGACLRPVHADLHGGNLKRSGDRLAVFDFDDSGLGLPVVDLAVTTFYLRDGDPGPEQALLDGYVEVASLPEVEPDHFEALVAARQLLLGNSLLASTTSALRSEAEEYLTVTVDRLRHWLATGAFTRAIPPR